MESKGEETGDCKLRYLPSPVKILYKSILVEFSVHCKLQLLQVLK
jgi:hypothetical protein